MSHQPETHIDIPAFLVRQPLFQELSPEQVAHIALHAREKRLTAGEMLLQKGDSPRGYYIIIFGQIKLAFPSTSGNEKVVDILGPRQSFGETVMFIDRPYPVFAEAIADTLLLHVAKDAIFELLETDSSFARRMLASMSTRLHALMRDVESYSLRSSAQRVIGYLMQHCPNQGNGECAGSVEVTLPTSKQIIASRLNLTPETLSRIFRDLAEAKLISVKSRRITIHDIKRLREYDM
ncbi:MAG: Crp/Fnr family transcriptional regulator [Rhodocyclaceae bacterium]|nr:Crp/Fnr family transcriptional regulator [Rhodocyclaceae bacterium]